MAHVFADATNPVYDPVTAKFNDGSFNLGMEPYDFGTTTALLQKADLTVAGMMQDCAECHVGGGGMEYVPAPTMADRVPLRNFYTDTFDHLATPKTFSSSNVTAFNYFIDTYDVNQNGTKLEALEMDYAKTGVLEMDCFICHLKGYDYLSRREMLREAKFDASRAVGAGIATANTVPWGDDEYGTKVVYNGMVEDDGGHLKINAGLLYGNLKSQPDSENCAFCHFNHGAVDWKKRGDNWQQDVNYDVHTVLGCMGCHEAKNGTVIGTSGAASSTDLGQCDPAKGIAPYSSIWNKTDGSIKTCEFCHLEGGIERQPVDIVDNTTGLPTTGLPESPGDGIQDVDGNGSLVWNVIDSRDYGAPDPTAKHQALGLTAVVASKHNDGVTDASHMDILDCSACHVRKVSGADWNTGGAVVDATGPDPEGRLADHENEYVHRLMGDELGNANLAYTWLNGKIIASNVLTTLYYRDKNDCTLDINNDARGGGMDTPLMTHILEVDKNHGWTSLTADNVGILDPTVIGVRLAALAADDGLGLQAALGVTGKTPAMKITIMSVPFKVQHSVSPARFALGKVCNDCHGAAAGIFNGLYELQGENMTLSTGAGQTTPLTKANSFETATDFHPSLKNRDASRTIGILSFHDQSTLRAVNRSEMLWEGSFKARNPAWIDGDASAPANYLEGGAISFPATNTGANTKGWWLKIEVDDGATVVTRTKMVGSLILSINADPVGDLLVDLGTTFNTTFGYQITKNDAGDGIRITADPGYKIRINPATTTSTFNLGNAVWIDTPITGVDGVPYADRASWVGHLNSITASAYGVNQDPVAAIVGLPGTVEIGTPVTLSASTDSANERYVWNVQDAPGSIEGNDVSYTFNNPGNWQVLLTVFNHQGEIKQAKATIQVTRHLASTTATLSAVGGGSATINLSNIPTHDQIYFFFGDGTRESVMDSAGSYSMTHAYRLRDTFLQGTNYVYKTSVQVKNAGAIVEVINVDVAIPQ